MMRDMFITAMCICLMTLAGCDKAKTDNDDFSANAKSTLAKMYPNATDVMWSTKNGYYIAKFNNPAAVRSIDALKYDFSVWINNFGQWCMTESEISYEALPKAVQDALRLSEYSGWKIDDIDKIERAGMETIYVIEVEYSSVNGEKEVDLYYSKDGVLIKTVVDVDHDYDYEDYLPSDAEPGVERAVLAKYPKATIIDIEYEDGEIEVEIIHDGRGKDVYFNKAYEWLRTEWDVRRSEIPVAVLEFISKNWPSYSIDDAEFTETPGGEWYEIEIEKGDDEIKVMIAPNGKPLSNSI